MRNNYANVLFIESGKQWTLRPPGQKNGSKIRFQKELTNIAFTKARVHAFLYCRHDAIVSGRSIYGSGLVPKSRKREAKWGTT